MSNDTVDSQSPRQPFPPECGERGSFIVSAIFFMFVFMMIAGFAVDLSSYLNKQSKLQNLADGAAKTAGRSLQQYRNRPEITNAYHQVREYIRQRQGADKLEIYPNSDRVLTAGEGDLNDNIVVRRMTTNCGSGGGSKPYFRESDGDSHPLPSCYGSNSDTFYLTGVVMMDHFDPMFMPTEVFGTRLSGMSAHAVARVEPATIERTKSVPTDTEPMNCGIITSDNNPGDPTSIAANNFTLTGGDLCANNDLEFTDNNQDLAIEQWEGAACNSSSNVNPCDSDDSDGAYRNTFTDEKDPPSFKRDDPDSYNVVINDTNYASWSSCGGGGKVMPGTGGTCIEQTNPDEYELSEDLGTSVDPESVYVDGDLTVSGNNTAVNGGIYSTGDVEVNDNNVEFRGDPDTLGGLSVWADGDLTVNGNNNVVRGIFGAGGDFHVTNNGGGNGDFQGLFLGNDDFIWENNSNASTLELDTSRFKYDVLDLGGWRVATSTEPHSDDIRKPLFANVTVNLVKE